MTRFLTGNGRLLDRDTWSLIGAALTMLALFAAAVCL